MTATAQACPSCGEATIPGERFCEGCGTPLAPPAAPADPAGRPDRTDLRTAAAAAATGRCPSCGDAGGSDGFCDGCGRPWPSGRDRVAEALPGAAAHTDRGRVRARNEDAYAAARLRGPGGGEVVVAIVCDGVGSVRGGERASLAGCEAGIAAAREAVEEGADVEATAAAADAAARAAVAGLAGPDRGTGPPPVDPPACTYVAAVVAPDRAVVSWIGDSRAYWLAPGAGAGDSRQVTVDDSWAAEVVAAELLDPQTAWSDPRAHVITRWMAADAPEGPAHASLLRHEGTGVLLLCSDGLWNHIPDAAALAGLLDAAEPAGPAAASALVDAALDAGGHDNVTVVLVDLGLPAAAPDEQTPHAEQAATPDVRTPDGSPA